MKRTLPNTLGVLLVLLGIAGFTDRGLFGMNLNPLHDLLLLVAGAGALYFGNVGTALQASYYMRALGLIFVVVGVLGFFFGPGFVTVIELAGRHSSHLLKIIPEHLEFGTADSAANLFFGIIALLAGFMPYEPEVAADHTAQQTKEKIGSGR